MSMMTLLGASLLMQDYEGGGGGGAMAFVMLLVWLVVIVFYIATGWKIFVKAGEPGWAVLVPIYNIIVLLKIADKPVWWIILFFIPIISLIPAIMVPLAIAEKFGKSVGFGVGLILLGFIFYPILAFGDAQYQG